MVMSTALTHSQTPGLPSFSYKEKSGRYRELQPVYYVPGPAACSYSAAGLAKYEFFDGTAEQHELVADVMETLYRHAYTAYREMLDAGIAPEVARAVLPVGLFRPCTSPATRGC
jgi:thymidylate synthase (FAD)